MVLGVEPPWWFVVEEVGPAFGNSSQERPRSLSGPLFPGPETRSLLRGCRYVSRPHGALKRETGASFESLCFSWRTVKAFRQSNRHSLLGGADLYPDRVGSLRLHGSAREAGNAEDRVELPLPAPSASAGHDVDQRDEGDDDHRSDGDDGDGGRGDDHSGLAMSSRGASVCGFSAARSAA